MGQTEAATVACNDRPGPIARRPVSRANPLAPSKQAVSTGVQRPGLCDLAPLRRQGNVAIEPGR